MKAFGSADAERHADMLGNRVRKNYRRLHRAFDRADIGAFRLYDRDVPEVRAVVDWYEGHVVIAEYTRSQTEAVGDYLQRLGRAVALALDIPDAHVHLKRRQTRPTEGARYERLAESGTQLDVREGALRFSVALDEYLDTGLFADHRNTRARVGAESAGKRFLNLYGYTGAFTCYAAAGGAKRTTTVDLSRNYLRWTRQNLELNDLWSEHHGLVREDVEAFLDNARRQCLRWDLCVLDPPSFSTRGGDGDLDIQRDHRDLIERTLGVLAPRGVLYFSTNHQRFEPDLDGLRVRSIEELTSLTVPKDYRNRQAHRVWRITVD